MLLEQSTIYLGTFIIFSQYSKTSEEQFEECYRILKL